MTVSIRIRHGEAAKPYPLVNGTNMRTAKTGTLVRALHDYEGADGRPRMLQPGYTVNYAVPETVPAMANKLDHFVALTYPWQKFWYEAIQMVLQGFNVPDGEPARWFVWDYSGDTKGVKKYVPKTTAGATPEYPTTTLKGVWQFMTEDHRALTDKNSIKQGLADYILGINTENPKPIRIKRLTFGGNVHEVIGYPSDDPAHIRQNFYAVRALNGGGSPSRIEDVMRDFPHLVGWCVEATPTKRADGTYTCGWFPPLKEWGVGTPFPFLAPGGVNYLEKAAVVSIGRDVAWSPYNPAR